MKATVDQAIFDLLDDLMTKDRDAVEGYKKACDNVSELDTKELLLRFARQRKKFVDSLKSEIKLLGGVFVDASSFKSSMHRIWIDLVGTFTGKDEKTVLSECLRGEAAALNDYKEAVKNELLPEGTRSLINNHLEMIKKAIEEIENQLENFDQGAQKKEEAPMVTA